jgi:hypothetical protein
MAPRSGVVYGAIRRGRSELRQACRADVAEVRAFMCEENSHSNIE